MTTFTGPTHWYPVVAVPVLILTITIALLGNKIVYYKEMHQRTLWTTIVNKMGKVVPAKPRITASQSESTV